MKLVWTCIAPLIARSFCQIIMPNKDRELLDLDELCAGGTSAEMMEFAELSVESSVPFSDICIPSPVHPMIATLTVPKTLNSTSAHSVLQHSRQAMALPNLASGRPRKMASVIEKNMIGRTASLSQYWISLVDW